MIRSTAQRVWIWHRTPESLWSRRITLAATFLFALLVTRWQPWNLLDRGGFSTDFYDAQAHAFLHGRLDVAPEVAGPEGFLIDGRTYLYYGPMLAFARMPFALFGHWADGRLSGVSLIVGFFVACTLTRHVAAAMGTTLATRVSPSRQALVTTAVAISPALSLAGWNTVYHETEMWAMACFLATIVALLHLWSAPSRRTLVIVGAAAISTVLTRSSVGFGALAATGLVGALLWNRHRRVSIAAIATMAAGVLLSVSVNIAKFGTLFDLPAERQLLSLQNPQRAAWFAGNDGSFFSVRFLPTTLVQYLRPDTIRFERLVPFVRFGPLAREYGSYPAETLTPSSSLTTSATLLSVLAVVGVVIIGRRRAWHAVALLAGATIAAIPSFLIGFVAHRYLVDMLPALIIPAAVAVAVAARPRHLSRRVSLALVAALAVWGLIVNVALGLWIQNLKEPGFTELRYAIDDLLFAGPPPSVIALVPGDPVPRDGVVAIDGACDGLYIAEQGRWVDLELADGIRRVTGTVDPATPSLRVDTPQGILTVQFDNGTGVAAFEPIDGEAIVGTPVNASAADTIVIGSDPITGRFRVSIAGREALLVFAAPDLASASFSESWQPELPDRSRTPICDKLVARQSSGVAANAHGRPSQDVLLGSGRAIPPTVLS